MTSRLYGEPRRCPVGRSHGAAAGGCERVVRAGHLMCAAHWREVPWAVQAAVWRTWRTWSRTHEDADWTAYDAARTAALDEVSPVREVETFDVDGRHHREVFVRGISTEHYIDGVQV